MYLLERDFQKDVKKWLERHDCVVYKTPAGLMTAGKYKYSVSSGFPDLIVYNQCKATLIELKTDSKSSKLRKSQVKRFKELRDVGIDVYVLRPKDWSLFKNDFNDFAQCVEQDAMYNLRTWEKDIEEYGQQK